MNSATRDLRLAVTAAFAMCLSLSTHSAENLTAETASAPGTNNVYSIDLPSTLRLAGARNLDVQIARERLNEAEANRQSSIEQFFPWLAPGVTFHRHDGLVQQIPPGALFNAHFQTYAPGVTLGSLLPVGDAIYQSLAAKQLVKVSDQALETERQDATLIAAQGYFDLEKAAHLVEVARQTLEISQNYQQQLHKAVLIGIAFKGDELRVQALTERDEISLRQAIEQRREVAAALAQFLHLDSRIDLIPQAGELTPITLFETNSALDPLVEQALRSRPELKGSQAFLAAARASKNGAVYGPMFPSVGAQVFGGGVGGGPDKGPQTFGAEGDVLVGVNWRIGPGGLLDYGRIHAGEARLASAGLAEAKLKDAIISEVVASLARAQSLHDQIEMAERNLATASEAYRLTSQRQQYGVGVVLENIQAQQDLAQARSQYVTVLAEYNKAQYALNKAVGGKR